MLQPDLAFSPTGSASVRSYWQREDRQGFDASLAQATRSAVRGVTLPWTLVVSALIGTWLMFTRLIFDTRPPMADSDHVVGALIVTVAVTAMAEVARPVRFINVILGAWLAMAPWMLAGASIALIALSLPRGTRSKTHYGGWDRYVV